MSHSTQQNKTDTESQVELLPAVANYLQVLNEQVLPTFIQTGSVPNAINAREGLANLTHTFVTETVDMALIVDDIIDCDAPTGDAYDVPVRLFYPSLPSDAANQTELTPLPVMLYFHGGGGTAGSVSVYHQILCRMAKHTGHIIIAPEYRLAPENPYPYAQNDACTTLLGLNKLLTRRKISAAGRVVVAGDSHGGALVTNLLRDPRIIESGVINDISAQVLIYPSVDFTMSCPSINKYANGYLLSRARIGWYFDQYFQHGEDRQSKSALFASRDELAHQPPALIINAAVDPLYDEGVAYAAKLSEAGVDTQHMTFDKVIHAYLNMENLNPDICQQTYQTISEFLGSKSSE